MSDAIEIKKLNLTDLNVYQCGHEECENSHSFGPAVRDHYLIHFIHEGKGEFHVNNTIYSLRKGQGFLIFPDIITFYKADDTNPWIYTWVGFNGTKASSYLQTSGLSLDNPIFLCENELSIEDCFNEMYRTKNVKKSREMRILGLLYIFLGYLQEINGISVEPFKDSERRNFYSQAVIGYIQKNYSRKITVKEIANNAGLDRSYLGAIFKSEYNMSIQEYLLHFRLSRACELMENELLTIGDISRSVGYDDPLLFSKMFKKYKRISPTQYRTNARQNSLI